MYIYIYKYIYIHTYIYIYVYTVDADDGPIREIQRGPPFISMRLPLAVRPLVLQLLSKVDHAVVYIARLRRAGA